MKLERHRDVLAEDIPRIYASIALNNPEAAERVLDAVEAALEQLMRQAESGVAYRTRNRKLRDVRMLPLIGFANYLVFYRVDVDVVRVLYLVHGARHLPRLFRRERRE